MSADLPVPIAPSEPPQTHSSPPRRPGEQNTAALPGGPTVPMPGTPAIAAFPASDPQTASSLSRELAELERARGALTSGKPKRAVEILEAYDATFPRGTLWQEATLLHVEARLRVGEVERAREVARRVLNVEPGGPHSVRVRSLFEHSAVDRN